MIYWLGSFRGDLVVKRRPVRCRLLPGPRRSGRPQSPAGRDHGGCRGQSPISQPVGWWVCCRRVADSARREGGRTGDGAAGEGPRVPAQLRLRGSPLLTLAAIGRKFLCFAAGIYSCCSERGNRDTSARVLGGSGVGPAQSPGVGAGVRDRRVARRVARRSRPSFAAARGRAGRCAPRSSLLPWWQRWPQPRAPRILRSACRGHTPSHPGRLRPALCGAGSRQEPSDRRGLSPPRTLSALGAGPAYLWLPGRPRPPGREVSRRSAARDWASSLEPRETLR